MSRVLVESQRQERFFSIRLNRICFQEGYNQFRGNKAYVNEITWEQVQATIYLTF